MERFISVLCPYLKILRLHLSQVTYKPKPGQSAFRSRNEWPQQLAVGIAIHQALHNRKRQDVLNGFDLCVDYSRILRLETQIASAVISRTLQGGTYIPEFVVPGRFIYSTLL